MSYTAIYALMCLISSLRDTLAIFSFFDLVAMVSVFVFCFEKEFKSKIGNILAIITVTLFLSFTLVFAMLPTQKQMTTMMSVYIIENDILPFVKDFYHNKTKSQCENGMNMLETD